MGEVTVYTGKKPYAGRGISELAALQQLRNEKAKLPRLVADWSLDKHIWQEIVTKKL